MKHTRYTTFWHHLEVTGLDNAAGSHEAILPDLRSRPHYRYQSWFAKEANRVFKPRAKFIGPDRAVRRPCPHCYYESSFGAAKGDGAVGFIKIDLARDALFVGDVTAFRSRADARRRWATAAYPFSDPSAAFFLLWPHAWLNVSGVKGVPRRPHRGYPQAVFAPPTVIGRKRFFPSDWTGEPADAHDWTEVTRTDNG